MAFSVQTAGITVGTTPASSSTTATIARMDGTWANQDLAELITYDFQYGVGAFTADTANFQSSLTDGGYEVLNQGGLDADRDYQFRARALGSSEGSKFGGTVYRRSPAVNVTASTPTSSAVTATTATVACNFFPNVNASTATAQLQYKKTTDPGWTNAGSSAGFTNTYAQQNISRGITGLTPSTAYQIRLVVTRDTSTGTSFTSATGSFTTAANLPDVTTNAATSVTHNSAVLNATVDPNNLTTEADFQWDVDSGAPYANTTTPAQIVSGDGAQAVSKQITGLSPSTTYYFRARGVWDVPADAVFGAEMSFTTPANPAAEAANEDHMTIYEFNERKYGVSSTINFAVSSPAATSSDRFFNSASPFVAGDVQVSKDGGAFANVGTLPVRIGTSPNFALTLSAAEMQASTIVVMIVDQDGPAFRDSMLVVRTKQELGNVDIDATQLTNTSAFKVTGVGTGHGIEAVGGATGQDINGILREHVLRAGTAQAGGASTITLDASASAVDSFYNQNAVSIIGGVGAGQFRIITGYVGATKVATVNRSWVTNPDATSVFLLHPASDAWNLSPSAELSAIPGTTASYGDKVQAVWQRFFFRRKQTTTTQTLYKADSSTTLGTATVISSGTDQEVGKLS